LNNSRKKFRYRRRYLANINAFGSSQLHLRNPLVIALWSVAFPGFGHFLLHKYLRGYALFIWELYINQKTLLNTAMMHSFNGNIQLAKSVLNEKYIYLYIPVYLFAIWDSYRTAVDENKLYLLAKRENAPFPIFVMNTFEVNYIDKKKPWLALVWSLGIPSMGQLYLHRMVSAAFTLIITLMIVEYSNFIEGFHLFFLGDIAASKAVIEPQWVLYMPSIYFFGVYDAYVNTVEHNKLFDREQANYLRKKYQSKDFVVYKGEPVQ